MGMAGLVLAGGRSRRFGGDKRFFRINGRTLLEIAVENLRRVCDRVYVASDRSDLPVKARVMPDEERYRGPLYGICYALRYASERTFLVLPVDMPYVSIRLLGKLYMYGISGFNVTIRFGGEVFPFPGVYSRDVLLYLEESANGRVMDFVLWAERRGRMRSLEVEDGDELMNLNFPPRG